MSKLDYSSALKILEFLECGVEGRPSNGGKDGRCPVGPFFQDVLAKAWLSMVAL